MLTIYQVVVLLITKPNQKNYRNGGLQKRDAIPMSIIYGVLGQLVGGCFRNQITNPFKIYDLHQLYKLYNPIILSSYLNRKGKKMEYRELYQKQLQENQDLKTQINILETILRNYIPVIEKKEEN